MVEQTEHPIPAAKDNDPEDVSWALSTAETMWKRGDHADALKWVRRAVEAASEAQVDDRALELAKAAADLTGRFGNPSASPPKTPDAPTATPPSNAPPVAMKPSNPPARPASGHPPAPASKPKPLAPVVRTPAPPRIAAVTSTSDRPTREMTETPRPPSPGPRSQPPPTQPRPELIQARAAQMGPTGQAARAADPLSRITDDMDAWPTNQIINSQHDRATSELTRIGGTPYHENMMQESVSLRRVLPTSQAMRVIIWRGPDGSVRVAPYGTAVNAITVEAMLVALDPAADLAAWLNEQ